MFLVFSGRFAGPRWAMHAKQVLLRGGGPLRRASELMPPDLVCLGDIYIYTYTYNAHNPFRCVCAPCIHRDSFELFFRLFQQGSGGHP